MTPASDFVEVEMSAVNDVIGKRELPGADGGVLPVRLTLLTAKTMAEILGVSVSTLWSWVDERGKHHVPDFPKPFKIGKGCTRWRACDIDAYLAKAEGVRDAG